MLVWHRFVLKDRRWLRSTGEIFGNLSIFCTKIRGLAPAGKSQQIQTSHSWKYLPFGSAWGSACWNPFDCSVLRTVPHVREGSSDFLFLGETLVRKAWVGLWVGTAPSPFIPPCLYFVLCVGTRPKVVNVTDETELVKDYGFKLCVCMSNRTVLWNMKSDW